MNARDPVVTVTAEPPFPPSPMAPEPRPAREARLPWHTVFVGLGAGVFVGVPFAVVQGSQGPRAPSPGVVLLMATALTGWLTALITLADRLAPMRLRAVSWGLGGLVAGAALGLNIPPDVSLLIPALVWALPAMGLGLMAQRTQAPLWHAPPIAVAAAACCTVACSCVASCIPWWPGWVPGLSHPLDVLETFAFVGTFVGVVGCVVAWCLHRERRHLSLHGK